MKTDKTKSSLLNAITMVMQTGVVSFLSLISTNLILKNYGSDFNGVVATATQFINFLMLIEGGFSLAVNVALFKPYVENNIEEINSIMSACKKTFFKIGGIFFLIGTLICLIYPLFIKSNLNYLTIFLIFLMAVSSTAFNLMFVSKSQVLFQVGQREYVYTFFATIISLLSSLTTILLVSLKVNMLIVRLSILSFSILNGFVILFLYKKLFKNINTTVKPDHSKIKGTKDIVVQKLTSVIYVTSPMLFISTFISTKMASVYAVYYSIYNIIKMFLSSITTAPLNGFGQLLANEKKEKVYDKFKTYEYIIILLSSILLCAVLIVILPFISLYTKNVTDINYVNDTIAILLALILFLEVIHIPSGNIINVNGDFKTAKKIQAICCIILILSLISLGYLFSIYGILIAILLTNTILTILEIKYTHINIFKSNLKDFVKKTFVNIALVLVLVILGRYLLPPITNYIMFLLIGFLTLIIVSIIITLTNYILFKKDINILKKLLLEMLKKLKKRG